MDGHYLPTLTNELLEKHRESEQYRKNAPYIGNCSGPTRGDSLYRELNNLKYKYETLTGEKPDVEGYIRQQEKDTLNKEKDAIRWSVEFRMNRTLISTLLEKHRTQSYAYDLEVFATQMILEGYYKCIFTTEDIENYLSEGELIVYNRPIVF